MTEKVKDSDVTENEIISEATIALNTLSDFIVNTKYARYREDLSRRENWEELCERNKQMHLLKFPKLKQEIENIYNRYVLTKKVLPSMRSMQFAGRAIERNESRIYNCSYLPIDSYEAFQEIMFLLLGGTGVGFSIQKRHIKKLPRIEKPESEIKYLIQDSVEGWANAVRALVGAYLANKPKPRFDYSDIRPKGSILKTSGGRAPGHLGLKNSLEAIEKILDSKESGSRLKSIEVHDIICQIAEAVLSGGIRRSAMISFFDIDDVDMLSAKAGEWWVENSQRAMANNSAVVVRHKVKKKDFKELWKRIKDSGSGEPGIYFTNDPDMLSNPCAEISLNPFGVCNLTEIDASKINSQNELTNAVKAAAFLGTLQAAYTDFHYLRPEWKANAEKEALLGISMTGVASGKILSLDLERAAKVAKDTNIRIAEKIGINPAARLTAIKPSGTTSLVLGTSSGVHAWHNDYYIRRVRLNKEEPIYKYLRDNNPEILVDDIFNPEVTSILEIPIKAPEGATLRTESALDLLNRVKTLHEKWIKPGHVKGDNTHNVSTTVSIKENEWKEVEKWMWENRDIYNGISVLPADTGTYQQTPFEDISKEEYERRIALFKPVDFTKIIEEEDDTNLQGELACAGGACEI